jgi:hypothetical protein
MHSHGLEKLCGDIFLDAPECVSNVSLDMTAGKGTQDRH